MNTNQAHRLTCTGPALVPGKRMERTWSCTCGETFYGYDAAVRREFRAHKASA